MTEQQGLEVSLLEQLGRDAGELVLHEVNLHQGDDVRPLEGRRDV